MRNICRDLGEVVLWRGRYPVPLASAKPLQFEPNAPQLAVAYYMRDWLDPVLDALLQGKGDGVQGQAREGYDVERVEQHTRPSLH
jgi:hypothetical protein